jgi:hypothetical protein
MTRGGRASRLASLVSLTVRPEGGVFTALVDVNELVCHAPPKMALARTLFPGRIDFRGGGN